MKAISRPWSWFKGEPVPALEVKDWGQESRGPAKKRTPEEARWEKRVRLARTNPPVAIFRPTHPTPHVAATNLRMSIRRLPARNSHPASEKKAAARRAQHKNDREVSSLVRRKACRNRLEHMEKEKPKRL